MIKARTAKFQIGQIVRHRIFSFRGVIFDIDPVFNNTEEWWLSIPEEVRPHKDQPFYHLLAENSESEYVAYVSEQNLLPDEIRRADPAFAGRRDLRQGQIRRLSPAQSVAELSNHVATVMRGARILQRLEPWLRAHPRIRSDSQDGVARIRACTTCQRKRRPIRAPFVCRQRTAYFAAGLAARRRPAGCWPRASCGLLRRASAALPAASSGFPRTPSDRSAGRHRPWRIRPSGSGSVSGAPLELIACTTRFWPFFILAEQSGVTS